ncbi:hypothetical protein HGRIS_000262 [Hohenbuehelia grisea]|uniref:Uncharacterized protein n=1 Tax=Hohenbuehelia grisea TaxID=104357 RepID=A0ABR3JR43_9AGAR
MKFSFASLVAFTFVSVVLAIPAELPDKLPMEKAVTMTDKVNNAWDSMKNHVLVGDGADTAGRHTVTSWQKKNKDEGWCHKETHICAFRVKENVPKTVWDDRKTTPNAFTDADVEEMCKKAIKFGFETTGQKPSRDTAVIVATKHGKKICVRYQVAGAGSCYPTALIDQAAAAGSDCEKESQSYPALGAQVPEGVRDTIKAK